MLGSDLRGSCSAAIAAELSMLEEYIPAAGEKLVRSDDRGQGLLFS